MRHTPARLQACCSRQVRRGGKACCCCAGRGSRKYCCNLEALGAVHRLGCLCCSHAIIDLSFEAVRVFTHACVALLLACFQKQRLCQHAVPAPPPPCTRPGLHAAHPASATRKQLVHNSFWLLRCSRPGLHLAHSAPLSPINVVCCPAINHCRRLESGSPFRLQLLLKPRVFNQLID